ncbi:MAG TPA: N-acetylmuramic acid 6-phosphate etherase, partial [Rhodobacterales bacterium]|nr:N-acetylmuramic acid 6-phosphate etherase [Rhodobacterales bacterium]
MSQPTTEARHPQAEGLDLRASEDILSVLWQGQVAAVAALGGALGDLARGGEAMARTIKGGGRLIYAAAGSSGMQALADGLEITPTFGVPEGRITVLRAGGLDDIGTPKEGVEDDIAAAQRDAAVIGADDCVICLAASGNTPYPVEIMQIAKAKGAVTIGLSNTPGGKLLEAD